MVRHGVKVYFRQVPIAQILDAEVLIKEYSAECAIPEIGEINPQRKIYENMETTGLMHSIGAFNVEGEMVGFATLLFFVLPHYGRKIANVESMFLTKSWRVGKAGRELMTAAENLAKVNGCECMLYNTRKGTKMERLLSLLSGYRRTNSVFLRSLA